MHELIGTLFSLFCRHCCCSGYFQDQAAFPVASLHVTEVIPSNSAEQLLALPELICIIKKFESIPLWLAAYRQVHRCKHDFVFHVELGLITLTLAMRFKIIFVAFDEELKRVKCWQ